MQRRERRPDVVDELQRLRHDRAVERVARDLGGVGEVADDRRLRVALLRHEDVDARDVGAVARRVVGRRDLEDAPADVGGVLADESLDEDPVDRRSPLVPPVRVDRRRPAQRAEVEGSAAPPVDVRRRARGAARRRTDSGTTRRTSAKAAMIVAVAGPAPRRTHRRRLPAPRRRRALARRLDRLPGPGPARPSSSSPSSAATPTRRHPSGGWDRRGGFATEGESARARREEDRRACAALGATPVGSPFGSVDYERHGGRAPRYATPCRARSTARTSCSFPAHRSPTPITRGSRGRSSGALDVAVSGSTPSSPTRSGRSSRSCRRWAGRRRRWAHAFEPVPVGPRDRLAKWRAIASLPLAAAAARHATEASAAGPHRYAVAPEWVAASARLTSAEPDP